MTTTRTEEAHTLLNKRVDTLELTLGFETNRETLKEGNNLFVFESMFSDDNNNVTVKRFEVSLGNGWVRELKTK